MRLVSFIIRTYIYLKDYAYTIIIVSQQLSKYILYLQFAVKKTRLKP